MERRTQQVATAAFVVAELAFVLRAEDRSPLRRRRETRRRRYTRNVLLGGAALATTGLFETPLVTRVAAEVERRGWGLLPRLRLSRTMRTAAAVVLLDYGVFAWHAALHRVPMLWRFHLVHHVDRDLDVTTGLRIHAVEIALSMAARVAQVVALGVSAREFALWQRLFGCCVLFHHANARLPERVERVLGLLIMTPRRHSIHHLARRDAQHGNWSSGLVVWDWVHGTLRDGDPTDEIGVPAYRNEREVTLAKMIALPFVAQSDPWCPR